MNVKSIYVSKDRNGNVKVSVLIENKWYIAITDNGNLISHYCEIENCGIENLQLDESLNNLSDEF